MQVSPARVGASGLQRYFVATSKSKYKVIEGRFQAAVNRHEYTPGSSDLLPPTWKP